MTVQLNNLWKKNFEIEELNFLAENTLIEIMPIVKTTMPGNITLLSVSSKLLY